MRLQFTDILGINKNVEIPSSQFEKALAGDIMFDGSSIEGFVRIEESRHAARARPRHVSRLSVGRSREPHLPIDLRHQQPWRRAVLGRSARNAQVGAREGEADGLRR